ncbi:MULTISPECIES: NUDIX domain-containing protein [unclassified Acidovorax]|uniref:NUDIX domain-containing protein n=1 Tax=unclassified Acidovorax TaxID=2684926 RepID=UPI001C479B39|nr:MULTISPECIES: NUDIX domain-containing protein [unclassified Acidovorax]MBV7426763.1 NUDIX domain-containing protein [Acidovorax sp. sif0732]MBV7447888.1 NUDIX domain-containing protein [Acidovorax sp. sif0715]
MSRPVPAVPIAELNARAEHVKLLDVQLLSDNWYVLRKVSFSLRRRDGQWQTLSREAYDRGNGAALLLFDPRRGTVVLTRQFRLPAFLNGCADGLLVEACAGLLDGDDPETCIRREAQEETGYRVRQPRKVFEAYMSPGSVTEKLHFFIAEYEPQDRVRAGGGLVNEGEDIEVIEMPLAEALAGIAGGAIQDGKTIMLLQHVALQQQFATV